jgi:hypothetical protein
MIGAVELDTLLEPLSLCLNAESARRLMAYHIDDSVHARIETLAERANEGSLNPEERAEYETLVNAADFIAILKLKARRRLDHTTHWDWTPQPDASFAKERDTAANTVCFTNGIGNLALAMPPLQFAQRAESQRNRPSDRLHGNRCFIRAATVGQITFRCGAPTLMA